MVDRIYDMVWAIVFFLILAVAGRHPTSIIKKHPKLPDGSGRREYLKLEKRQ